MSLPVRNSDKFPERRGMTRSDVEDMVAEGGSGLTEQDVIDLIGQYAPESGGGVATYGIDVDEMVTTGSLMAPIGVAPFDATVRAWIIPSNDISASSDTDTRTIAIMDPSFAPTASWQFQNNDYAAPQQATLIPVAGTGEVADGDVINLLITAQGDGMALPSMRVIVALHSR